MPMNQIGVEILQIFMADLLGRDSLTARFFSMKTKEDFQLLPVVSPLTKVAALFGILSLNGIFIYFSILRGYEKGLRWQRAYLFAAIVQFIIDVFVFESLETMYLHYVVPSLVPTKEFEKVLMVLNDIISHLCEVNLEHDSYYARILRQALYPESQNNGSDIEFHDTQTFNASGYLFVSHNVAKAFPQLLESILVLSYTSLTPGDLYMKWRKPMSSLLSSVNDSLIEAEFKRNNVATSNNNETDKIKNSKSFGDSLVAIKMRSCTVAISLYLTRMIINTPFEIQRICLRILQPIVIGASVLAWLKMRDNPVALALVASFVVAFIVFCAYRYLDYLHRHFMVDDSLVFKMHSIAQGEIKASNPVNDVSPINMPSSKDLKSSASSYSYYSKEESKSSKPSYVPLTFESESSKSKHNSTNSSSNYTNSPVNSSSSSSILSSCESFDSFPDI